MSNFIAFCKLPIVIVALFAIALPLRAQVHWHQTSGPDGGVIEDIAVAANGDLYAGGNYLYRSTDRGQTWSPLTSLGQRFYVEVETAYQPAPNGTIYVRGISDDTVRRSTDNGESWTVPAGLNSRRVFDFEAPSSVLIINCGDTIWRSIDFGETIEPVFDLVPPGRPSSRQGQLNTVAVGTGYMFMGMSASSKFGTIHGVYRSVDGGRTWQGSSVGFQDHDTAVQAFTFVPNGILLGMGSSSDLREGGGVYRSTDDGRSWNRLTLDQNFVLLATAPNGWVTGYWQEHGLYLSTDYGTTWRPTLVTPEARNVTQLARTFIGGTLLATTESDGIYRSDDLGQTWSRSNSGIVATDVVGLFAPTPNELVAATFTGGVFRTTDAGNNWIKTAQLGENINELARGFSDGILHAATFPAGLQRSTDNGATWASEQGDLPHTDVLSIAVGTATTLYAYAEDPETFKGDLYRTIDGGAHWGSLGFAAALGSDVEAVSLAVTPGGTVVATTYSNGLWRRTIAGTWERAAPSIFTTDATATILATTAGTLLATAVDPNTGIRRMYRSTNEGVNWSPTGRDSVSTLANSLGGAIIAGGKAYFLSTDEGLTWRQIGDSLPDIHDAESVAMDPIGNEFIGTRYGGVFRLNVPNMSVPLAPTAGHLPVAIVPNPAFGRVLLSFDLAERGYVDLRIIDALGRIMMSIKQESLDRGKHHVTLETDSFPAGSYVIELRSAQGYSIQHLTIAN
jgi:photosystem II stability/assembly factor-like uncharacterized protein